MQNIVYHLLRSDSSAVKFKRVEDAFILVSFRRLKQPDRRKRGGNRSSRRKPLTWSFRKYDTLKSENSSYNRDSNPHCSIGGRRLLGKQTCQTFTPRVSLQNGIIVLGKAHTRSIPPPRSFCKDAFETVTTSLWCSKDHSGVEHRPLPLSISIINPLAFILTMDRGHGGLVNCVRAAMSKSVSEPNTFVAANAIYSSKFAGHDTLASTFVATYKDLPIIF